MSIFYALITTTEPHFASSIPPQDVTEKAAVGRSIVTVQASDADLGRNSEISYSFIGGNSLGYFEIDSETGQITVLRSLDLDDKSQTHSVHLKYMLTIKARDNGTEPLSNTTSVEITIIPENEFTPQFADSGDAVEISEGIDKLSEVYNAIATDSDYGVDGQIVYSIISESNMGYFFIDSGSGKVTVAKSLDREAIPEGITLIIQVEDQPNIGLPKTASMVLLIELLDVNDEDPVFNGSIAVQEISEDVTVGTLVTQVQATDQDIGENAKISYSITNGNSLGFFEINTESGQVTMATFLDLKTEIHTEGLNYTLTIAETDSGTPARFTLGRLDIIVKSVNEFPPQFDKAVDYIMVAQSSPVSKVVYKPAATT